MKFITAKLQQLLVTLDHIKNSKYPKVRTVPRNFLIVDMFDYPT